MKATVTKFNKFESKGMLGFVDFTLAPDEKSDPVMIIKGATLRMSENGMWLAPPSKKNEKSGEWENIVTFYKSSKDKQNPFGDALVDDIISQCRVKMSSGTTPPTPKKQAPTTQAPMDDDIPF